jgi:CBS domain-containing protein
MKVREVMTNRVPRVRADSDLQQAAEVVALSGASDLMVVNERGELAGVISAGDILRACLPKIDDILAEGGSLEQAFALVLKMGRSLARRPIAPLTIAEPITLDPDDHVAKVAVTFVQNNIHSLPVVKEGRLLGLVTRASLLETVVGGLHGVSSQGAEPIA